MSKSDIATQGNTAVGAVIDYAADAGAGFEQADKEAFAIPFITILQSGSPQCKKSDGKYIKGAEEGMLYNTVTEEIISGETGILVVPCHYDRMFLEFGDRDAGDSGFYGSHEPSSQFVLSTPIATEGKHKGKQVTSEGHILSDTREHYVLVVNPEAGFTPAVIGMSSTQVKASRSWMSKMDGVKMRTADGRVFTPPMFSHIYRLTTVPQSNDQGSWYGWKVELVEQLQDAELYQAAKKFRDAVKAGEAKAKVVTDEEEEIPF